MTKTTVAIIEPSPIIELGLEVMFERMGPQFNIIGHYPDIVSFLEQSPQGLDMILLDTYAIGFSKNLDLHKMLPGYEETLLIALTSENILPQASLAFDGVLNIYDDWQQIFLQLEKVCLQAMSISNNQHSLSAQHRDIIVAIAKGATNQEIAEQLSLSTHTVATYRKRIASKIGVRGTAGFTSYAHKHCLMVNDDV